MWGRIQTCASGFLSLKLHAYLNRRGLYKYTKIIFISYKITRSFEYDTWRYFMVTGAYTGHLIYYGTEFYSSIFNKESRLSFQCSSSNSKRLLTSRTLIVDRKKKMGIGQQYSRNEVDTLSNSRPWPCCSYYLGTWITLQKKLLWVFWISDLWYYQVRQK